jgi:hypothetical protein
MADRDAHGAGNDPPRPLPRRRSDLCDPGQAAGDAVARSWRRGAESRYGAASGRRGPVPARQNTTKPPLDVHIEFVRMDGPPGQALRRRQATIMRKVLQWIAEHPIPGNR